MNGKVCHQQSLNTWTLNQRVQGANEDKMRVVKEKVVLEGEWFWKALLPCNPQVWKWCSNEVLDTNLLLPIMLLWGLFPSTQEGKTIHFLKTHIMDLQDYFYLDLKSNMIARQPTLTIGEVQGIMERQVHIWCDSWFSSWTLLSIFLINKVPMLFGFILISFKLHWMVSFCIRITCKLANNANCIFHTLFFVRLYSFLLK